MKPTRLLNGEGNPFIRGGTGVRRSGEWWRQGGIYVYQQRSSPSAGFYMMSGRRLYNVIDICSSCRTFLPYMECIYRLPCPLQRVRILADCEFLPRHQLLSVNGARGKISYGRVKNYCRLVFLGKTNAKTRGGEREESRDDGPSRKLMEAKTKSRYSSNINQVSNVKNPSWKNYNTGKKPSLQRQQ